MGERQRITVEILYSIMQSAESKLGGGEGVEGIYGSITASGMSKILDSLHHSCGLGPGSALLDVGAGLGRPLLHAMAAHGVRRVYGVEVDSVKVYKADAFVDATLAGLATRGVAPLAGGARPHFTCAPVEQVATLEPATHAYSFWEGVPEGGRRAFGRLFAESRSLKAVAVVQRSMRGTPPGVAMAALGFGPVVLIRSFPVAMSGSGRSFTAYVFSKMPTPSAELLQRALAPPRGPCARVPAATPALLDGADCDTADGGDQPQGMQGGVGEADAYEARLQQRLAEGKVLLRTESSQASPVKRQPGACGTEDSPPKRPRGTAGPPAPASAPSGYCLRPRRLYSSSSDGSTCSTSTGIGAGSASASGTGAGSSVQRVCSAAARPGVAAGSPSVAHPAASSDTDAAVEAVHPGEGDCEETAERAGRASLPVAAHTPPCSAAPQGGKQQAASQGPARQSTAPAPRPATRASARSRSKSGGVHTAAAPAASDSACSDASAAASRRRKAAAAGPAAQTSITATFRQSKPIRSGPLATAVGTDVLARVRSAKQL